MTIPALLARIEAGRTDLIHDLLTSARLDDLLSCHGAELMRWSGYFGDVGACKQLNVRGVDLANLGDNLGLQAAAFHGHWQLCEFLLESGASASAVVPDTGESPLHAALTNEDRLKYDLVVRVLLDAGAEPNARTRPGVPTGSFMRGARTKGETPLHRAALFGTESTIQMLLDAGANPEAEDVHADTALAWASWARRPVGILRLLLHGEHRIHPQYRPLRAGLLGQPALLPGSRPHPRGGPFILRAVHPVLPARDVAASLRFFQGLGFNLLAIDSEHRPRYAVVARDLAELHLQWTDEGGLAHPMDRPVFRFPTDDVDGLFADLRETGAVGAEGDEQSPWSVPADTPWGTREFHVRDPAGNNLQFYQRQ